ncbi:MAG: outer membrane protein [Vicinamibacterales bacterium]
MRLVRFVIAFVLACSSGAAYAQEVSKGDVEVMGFAGGVTDGGGATFGGGVHYAFSPRLLLAVEAGYLTGSDDFSGFGVDVDSHGFSFDVNLHYLFPQRNTPKFTPYVLGGIGYLRASASATVAGTTFDESASDTGLNIGGGARWQVGSRWGLKPEIKVLIADNSSVRFAVGIYRR